MTQEELKQFENFCSNDKNRECCYECDGALHEDALMNFINQLLKTRQEKMVDIINRLEIVATREDNPTNKEKAELVKEIWELWIKPVVIQNLIKV